MYYTVNFVEAHVPVCNAGTRVGPPARSHVKMDDINLKEEVYKETLVWILSRLHCTSQQTVKVGLALV